MKSYLRPLSWALVVSVVGQLGCNGFWDDFRSREFTVGSMFEEGPDPIEVLKSSKDGDKRARAYRALGEYDLSTVTPEEKKYVLALLSTGALKEQQAWARLRAVQALGNFQEKEAVKGLEDAYYRANSFSPESSTILKSQILTSLGQTNQPEAIPLLSKILKEPPVEGSVFEEQQRMDERIAAARALGKLPYFQATEPLVEALRTEKNLALRNSVHQSLQSITDRDDIPAEAQAWADFVQQADQDGRGQLRSNPTGLRLSEIVPVNFFGSK